jgi:hypothetical protein
MKVERSHSTKITALCEARTQATKSNPFSVTETSEGAVPRFRELSSVAADCAAKPFRLDARFPAIRLRSIIPFSPATAAAGHIKVILIRCNLTGPEDSLKSDLYETTQKEIISRAKDVQATNKRRKPKKLS